LTTTTFIYTTHLCQIWNLGSQVNFQLIVAFVTRMEVFSAHARPSTWQPPRSNYFYYYYYSFANISL